MSARGGRVHGRRGGHEEEHEEHENHERWLVSYADMMTLLMVLFIVMFAISSINQGKFDQSILTLDANSTDRGMQEQLLNTYIAAGHFTDADKLIAKLLAAAPKDPMLLGNQGVLRMQDGKYSNQFDANLAINCADTDQKVDESEIRRLAADWDKKYPLFGAGSAGGLYACSVGQAQR